MSELLETERMFRCPKCGGTYWSGLEQGRCKGTFCDFTWDRKRDDEFFVTILRPEYNPHVIQRGCVGDSALFWAAKHAGYTVEIIKAHLFPSKEAALERLHGLDAEDGYVVLPFAEVRRQATLQLLMSEVPGILEGENDDS